MKKTISFIFSVLIISASTIAQNSATKTQKGHTNQNKFRQLKEMLATPNSQRTASGAPGKDYSQQKVDYDMSIVLDDNNQKITGLATPTSNTDAATKAYVDSSTSGSDIAGFSPKMYIALILSSWTASMISVTVKPFSFEKSPEPQTSVNAERTPSSVTDW